MNFEVALVPFAPEGHNPLYIEKMLEEKNDNLLNADGNVESKSIDNSLVDETSNDNVLVNDEIQILESTVGNDTVISSETIELENESKAETETNYIENSEILTNIMDAPSDSVSVIDAISESNAEESEDESMKKRHEIPMLDYETLSLELLVEELKSLSKNENVSSVKSHVEELRKVFLLKFNHFLEEKKEEFISENPDTTEDFKYNPPLKAQFDQFYNQYRDKKNLHFNSLQTNLKVNLNNRLTIVAELKELIDKQENIKESVKHFNELRERWKNAGPIPKDKYNHVWNNYHFHLENFYDYLHLDREVRDLDFKHNLELKQKIVARAEELVLEADTNKAFIELQDLHKIWKEDIGPVSREHREDIWKKFSDLTKQMHDQREILYEKIRANQQENLLKKKYIISKIEELSTIKVDSHSLWNIQVEKVESLRNEFLLAGKVPTEVTDDTWSAFKKAVTDFNSFKNSFYKDIKKEQNNNLAQKKALIAKAQELQDSADFTATTPIMKQIQEDWKKIGHVPRKISDEIWSEFRAACNHYFDKLKEQKSEESSVEIEAFNGKKAYLATLEAFELTGVHKTDLDAIKLHIENWKKFGKVPFTRRHIEGKFNKILDVFFEKLTLSKKDSEMMRFSNRMDQLSESNDTRKIENEKIFLSRKIDEIKNEIFQLENNIQFFTNTRNAKKENSIVLEVRKNIQKHKDEMDILKEKLKQLKTINNS